MNERSHSFFYHAMMSISFIAVIFIISIVSIFTKSQRFSDMENRGLSQNPTWKLSSWLDKSYMQDYNSYRNDQFAGRNTWVNIKTKTEIALGKKELNSVYMGEDKALFEPFVPGEKKQREQTIHTINAFAKKHEGISFQMLLVPNAVAIQDDLLPSFVVQSDQLAMIEKTKASLTGFTWVDVVKPLQKHHKEYLYYRNDHHWTTLGAKYAFDAFVATNGIDVSAHPLEKYLVSNQFYGTLASRSSFKGGVPDDIYMYDSTNVEDKYTVSYVEEQQKNATLFDADKLKTNDQYGVFLGGNHPVLEINTNSSVDKKLMILKDSYANCFIPFLTPYYSRIVVVDPRYYAGDVNQLMKDQAIDEVLFLFNANTFYQDTSLDVLLAH